MELILSNYLIDAFVIVFVLILAILIYFKHAYQYWEKKGVPTIPPRIPLGNSNILLPKSFGIGTLSRKLYDKVRARGEKFAGVYLTTEPNLVVVDPDYIKDILTKDFHNFVDRGFYHNEKDDPISAHLFAIDGLKWRNLRTKLTPTFTSGKMKMMFHTIIECSKYMEEAMEKYADQQTDIEIKEVLGCFTTDVIGSCAFGINCNSFLYPDAEFRTMGKRIFESDLIKSMKSYIIQNSPNLAKKLSIAPNKRDVTKFFMSVVKDSVKAREQDRMSRNDFLQILIDLKNKSFSPQNGKDVLFSVNEMAAQVFLFFIAGFETSATAMTFTLYELARNEKIQQKIRDEINQVLAKYDGKITYENIKEMEYLGQALNESLRKYPPVPTLNRRCTKDYTLRDTNIVLEKGTSILISVLGLHYDPEYYPDPETYDPDRFSECEMEKRHPYVHLPFGEGPRNCIGLRFGTMQSTVGIITIIKNFKLTVSPKTKPVELDPKTFLLATTNKIYLRAEKI